MRWDTEGDGREINARGWAARSRCAHLNTKSIILNTQFIFWIQNSSFLIQNGLIELQDASPFRHILEAWRFYHRLFWSCFPVFWSVLLLRCVSREVAWVSTMFCPGQVLGLFRCGMMWRFRSVSRWWSVSRSSSQSPRISRKRCALPHSLPTFCWFSSLSAEFLHTLCWLSSLSAELLLAFGLISSHCPLDFGSFRWNMDDQAVVVERDICGGAISINFHCSSTVFDCFRLFPDCFAIVLRPIWVYFYAQAEGAWVRVRTVRTHILKKMDFRLKMMDFVLNMMDFVLKLMDFVLKMMDFTGGDCVILQGVALTAHLQEGGTDEDQYSCRLLWNPPVFSMKSTCLFDEIYLFLLWQPSFWGHFWTESCLFCSCTEGWVGKLCQVKINVDLAVNGTVRPVRWLSCSKWWTLHTKWWSFVLKMMDFLTGGWFRCGGQSIPAVDARSRGEHSLMLNNDIDLMKSWCICRRNDGLCAKDDGLGRRVSWRSRWSPRFWGRASRRCGCSCWSGSPS